ncbi:MAG: PH domain-containing protein [Methanobrevibacter sp.]|nr:PH domain-containing protein [Methanobrevibacter sp.]
MAKYCQNCGEELEEDQVFCSNCGSKIGETKSTVDNINKSFSKLNDTISNVSDDFSDSFSYLFDIYRINMMNDERVIKHAEIHPGSLYVPLLFVGIAFLLMIFTFFIMTPVFVLAMAWLVIRFISYTSTDLILTNKRVFGKTGLISTTQMQSPLNMINSVAFNNGIIGKLLGYGTVHITTASTVYKFRYIKDGQTIYSDIFNQLERSKKEQLQEHAEAIAEAIARKD